MQQDKEKAILDITQEMVRQGGYNGFSFRNIAAAVGIKSSSVHYHFATKEELGVAVTRYYTDQFIDALGDPEQIKASGENPVVNYIAAFRKALAEDKGMCLCGMLGAEADILPERVVEETRAFFDRNVAWLEQAYSVVGQTEQKQAKALQALSILEGAMIICNVGRDLSTFDIATQLLLDDAQNSL